MKEWDGRGSQSRLSNEPFGSRSEPGSLITREIRRLSPGEIPEGRARGDQDTATQVQSESERSGPVREPGVTPIFDSR